MTTATNERHQLHREKAAEYGFAVWRALRDADIYAADGYTSIAVDRQQFAASTAMNAWRHAQHVDLCQPCEDGGCAVLDAATAVNL